MHTRYTASLRACEAGRGHFFILQWLKMLTQKFSENVATPGFNGI